MKQDFHHDSKKHHLLVSVIVLLLFLLLAGLIVPMFDREATVWLMRNPWPGFTDIMSRSLFERHLPGVGDIGVIFGIIVSLSWICVERWRTPTMGFLFLNSFVISILSVHGPKWVWARARPEIVAHNPDAFSHWFTFGTHHLSLGRYSGSFPSGHAASIFVLMALVYVLPTGRRIKAIGAIIVLLGTVAMGLARAMAGKHWLSDILVAIPAWWLITHSLYHLHRHLHHKLTLVSPLLELKIALALLLFFGGTFLAIICLREYSIAHDIWILGALGGILCAFAGFRILRFLIPSVSRKKESCN